MTYSLVLNKQAKLWRCKIHQILSSTGWMQINMHSHFQLSHMHVVYILQHVDWHLILAARYSMGIHNQSLERILNEQNKTCTAHSISIQFLFTTKYKVWLWNFAYNLLVAQTGKSREGYWNSSQYLPGAEETLRNSIMR